MSTLFATLGRAHAQSQHTIANQQTTITFTKEAPATGSDLFLSSIVSATGASITFEPSLALWKVEVRIDPTVAANAQYDLSVTPDQLGSPSIRILSGVNPPGGSGPTQQTLQATWTGSVPAATGSGTGAINLTVVSTWNLGATDDTVAAEIVVTIANPSSTTYRLWLVRYPRVAAHSLDTKDGNDANGSDCLATARTGGFLYGDPIGYVDPASLQGYTITSDPHHANLFISPDAIEPGYYSVPVGAYYDRTTGQGLYVANNDEGGFLKGFYFYQEPQTGPAGVMVHETAQYPADTLNATVYDAPYAVQLAALADMDWITAANKYRKQFRTYSWYPGAAGSAQNTKVPTAMKQNPLFGSLSAGSGYCPSTTGEIAAAQNALTFFNNFMGVPFPMLMFNRFIVDPPSEVTLATKYMNAQPLVASLVTSAEQAGNRVGIHAMTEKFAVFAFPSPTNPTPGNCGLCNGTYCTNFDMAIKDMNMENTVWQVPTQAGAHPCPKGKGDPGGTGVDLPAWFSCVSAQFANSLGATGGQGWTSPNPWAGWCFSPTHDHAQGFGNFFAQGWLQMVRDVSNQVTTTTEFPTIMETSVAFFSQEIGVMNAMSFDYSADLNNFNASNQNLCQGSGWNLFFNAEIRRIPFFQMACDSVRAGTVYFTAPCSMPYTSLLSPSGLQDQLFEPFPAVSAALACWSMGQRVLTHQGCLVLSDIQMVDPAVIQNPGTDDAAIAAADMMGYYRGLNNFLRGTTPEALMRFHAGALERTPDIQITNASETFALRFSTTISTHFPQLKNGINAVWAAFNVNGSKNLDFGNYQPIKQVLGVNCLFGNFRIPPAAEENPTWLPRGMYRHEDGSRLALLMSNPWGAKQLHTSGALPPMNPFSFNYANPPASSGNVYNYTGTFDPATYEGFPTSYQYARAIYDVNGTVINVTPFVATTGPLVVSGSLAPFESVAWIFKP